VVAAVVAAVVGHTEMTRQLFDFLMRTFTGERFIIIRLAWWSPELETRYGETRLVTAVAIVTGLLVAA
jgi:hypothetical protein